MRRTAIAASLPKSRSRRCKTYRAGRVCLYEGCTTILSRYNPARLCSLHESLGVNSTPERRPRRPPETWLDPVPG